jgi:hypothetical protein
MRILKYILLLLLLLSVAFVVFVATQQSDYKVIRSKEIKISKDIVYNLVSDSTSLSIGIHGKKTKPFLKM